MSIPTVADSIDSAELHSDTGLSNFSWRGILGPDLLRYDLYYEFLRREFRNRGNDLTLLDVGCGHVDSPRALGINEFDEQVSRLWGVEPDTTGDPAPQYQRVWQSTLENADVPDDSVDMMISYFVVEHVQSPEEFMACVLRVLKPGGVFLAATVNLNCVFAQIAKKCQTFGVQDQVLRLVRGRQLVDQYHYPAYYRLNTCDALMQQAEVHRSILAMELTYFENDEWYHYLPRPVRFMGAALRKTFHRREKNFSYLFLKLTKE